MDGNPGVDAGVPDLPKNELVDFYTQALRDLGADPRVGSEGGAWVISFESDVGSGSVRITEGTPTTIELVLRS